jgi:hypothetical protein
MKFVRLKNKDSAGQNYSKLDNKIRLTLSKMINGLNWMAPKCARSNGSENWREKWGENIRATIAWRVKL